MSEQRTAYMRKYRATEKGALSVRVRRVARDRAVAWVIAEHPDAWRQFLGDARVENGLQREAVTGRPPTRKAQP